MLMAYASSMAGSMRNPRCRLNYCSRKCPIKHRTRDSGSTAERAGVKAPCSRERPRLPSAPRQITLGRGAQTGSAHKPKTHPRNLPLPRKSGRRRRSAPPRRCRNPTQRLPKWTLINGWPRVWAEISDEELRDRLRQYLLLAANGPNCIAWLKPAGAGWPRWWMGRWVDQD